MEALMGPEPVTLCTQLPIISWVMKATSHKLSLTIKALIRGGAKPGPSGVSHLKEEGLTCPQSLARCHIAEGGHPSPGPLISWGYLYDQLSEQQKGITYFIDNIATSTCDGILWRAACFSSSKQDIPENGPKSRYNWPNSRQSS